MITLVVAPKLKQFMKRCFAQRVRRVRAGPSGGAAASPQVQSGHYGARVLDRIQWPANDPTLISEGVFAMANVFSFARIIYLFQTNPHLGPLQISLGCMIIDIAKFLFIFFLVLTSFVCGLNQLYWYYDPTMGFCETKEVGGLNITFNCHHNPDAFLT